MWDERGDAPCSVAWSIALTVVALAVAACGPAPGPGRPAPAPGVLGIGDSVMLGASGALQAAIPGVEVDAVVSRQFREAPGIAYWRSQAGLLPGTVVVHLGTNGTVLPGTCDELMAVLGDRRVILVDLTVPRSWEAGNNVTLRDCAARDGCRVRRLARDQRRPGGPARPGRLPPERGGRGGLRRSHRRRALSLSRGDRPRRPRPRRSGPR